MGTRRKLSILSWKNVLKFEVLQVSPAGFCQSSLHFPAKSRDPPGNYAKLSHFFKYLTRRAKLFTVFRKIPGISMGYDLTLILRFIFFSSKKESKNDAIVPKWHVEYTQFFYSVILLLSLNHALILGVFFNKEQ